MELECSNGILLPFIRAIRIIAMMDGKVERWPDVQRLPDWGFDVAENC
jgi:hypothetical protein